MSTVAKRRYGTRPEFTPPPAVPVNRDVFTSLVRVAGNYLVKFWDDPLDRSFRYANPESKIAATKSLRAGKPVNVRVVEEARGLMAEVTETRTQ